ncbi:hypothetical protein EW146_g4506 [Bondarzewia mesenterica]|uniref:Uncharacterized protein n=1 Tax=Bondarzewia mesenterica TaxID=1095465 RepID=A0A4S4LWL0_9AGAM|nr:hypothetical protein EW146_g4506 [Bondarzewia mesenterica]
MATRRTRSTSYPQPLTQLHTSSSSSTTTGSCIQRVPTSSLPPKTLNLTAPISKSASISSTKRCCTNGSTRRPARARASSSSLPLNRLFTPSTPPIVLPRSRTPSPPTSFLVPRPAKSVSAPHLTRIYTFLSSHPDSRDTESDADDDDDDDDDDDIDAPFGAEMIYTANKLDKGSSGFRTRFLSNGGVGPSLNGKYQIPKGVTTTPGQLGAGETETETDEPPRHLPTSRIVPESGPLIPPNSLEQTLTPLLFEAFRLLSIVPAVFGTMYNIYRIWHPPLTGNTMRVDYFVSALWVCNSDRIPMPAPDHGAATPVESILPPALDADPAARTPSDMLARDAPDARLARTRASARRVLGGDRDDDVRIAFDTVVGHE